MGSGHFKNYKMNFDMKNYATPFNVAVVVKVMS